MNNKEMVGIEERMEFFTAVAPLKKRNDRYKK
jgi:hypothetical protein